jgi:copper(I)-binding protein
MRAIASFIAAAVLALPAFAADIVKGDLKISQPWARATPGGVKVAAGYVTITNTGKTADKLTGGSATFSGTLELHDMTMTDGVMRMRQIEGGIELKPGATIALKPGGMHLMLMDLKQPLKQGEKLKGTLVFEKAGSVEIEFDVAAIGAAGPGGDAANTQHKGH